jgi:hypothetical protein
MDPKMPFRWFVLKVPMPAVDGNPFQSLEDMIRWTALTLVIMKLSARVAVEHLVDLDYVRVAFISPESVSCPVEAEN